MITAELFVLAQLFMGGSVSWWWIALFIFADGVMWSRIEK